MSSAVVALWRMLYRKNSQLSKGIGSMQMNDSEQLQLLQPFIKIKLNNTCPCFNIIVQLLLCFRTVGLKKGHLNVSHKPQGNSNTIFTFKS